jgi:hypothetical protein
MNRTVAIVCPETHLGGLTTSGLGWTDSKNGNAIGGIARDFYRRIYLYYDSASSWTKESREAYIRMEVTAQPGPAIDTRRRVQWVFEPHVAERVINTWIKQARIPVYRNEWLIRDGRGVVKNGSTIASINTHSGKSFTASMFIDAGYEGDLMAAAGIPYDVGRDSRSSYNEPLAGVLLENTTSYIGISPYVEKNSSSSGLISGIEQTIESPLPINFNGAADSLRLQSFNFRLCLTQDNGNKVPFSAPTGYNAAEFELLVRYYEAGHTSTFANAAMPNKKTDSNSAGLVGFDWVGGNFNYTTGITFSEASYEERAEMVHRHMQYQQGLLWTMSNNSRIPVLVRNWVNKWGLSKDEFEGNGNWPYQLYVREARRMKGMYTLSQQDIQHPVGFPSDTVIGLGSYSIDSHVVRRLVVDDQIYNEGGFYVTNPNPYPIPYGSIIPHRVKATNLLNPITVSASHVAFGSVRMEPTYMILGQSAATAAVLAIEEGMAVQDVDRSALTARLIQDKQVLCM